MNRLLLLENIRETLLKSGFDVSNDIFERMICFDIIAKRDGTLLVIKILVNIDSFNKNSAMELKIVSKFLDGSPIVIGNHSSGGHIEDGAVYLRHGIPIMSPSTAYDYFVEDRPPLIFAAPGGFFVKIDGENLRQARQAKGLSLGTLADTAGVSRRAVQMYEEGMNAMVDIAIKLQEFLDEPIIVPCNPLDSELNMEEVERFKSVSETQKHGEEEVFAHLTVLGYDVIPTLRSPFNAITAKQKVLILTGIEGRSEFLKRRAKTIHDISKLVEKHSVFFVHKSSNRPNIEGTPIIAVDELKTIEDFNEIIELISERAE